MTIPRKVKVILVLLGLVGAVVAWQYLSYVFKRGYSRGSRTGIVRKVSVKGPPYCKYLEGELALQGGNIGQSTEIFTFTIDDDSDKNPLVQELKKAEREGTRVTVEYRQDKHLWWRCNAGGMADEKSDLPDSQYFIVNVTH